LHWDAVVSYAVYPYPNDTAGAYGSYKA